MRSARAAHHWSSSGACDGDALEAALAQGEATLWYGSHSFEFTRSMRHDGSSVLRLAEVSRRSETASGRSVLVAVQHGYAAQELVPRCHGSMDEAVLRAIEARLLRAVGRRLFADAAFAVDLRAAA